MPSQLARPRFRSLVAGCVAIATVLVVGGGVAVAATHAVTISGFAFSPSSITINVGDRVTWTNSDAVTHTATATNGAFDTGDIDEGQSRSVKFTKPGTYAYVCTPHPTMTGSIRVRAGRGPTDPPTDTVAPVGAVEAEADPWATPAALIVAAALLVGLAAARRRPAA